ncbi:MAG: hypothetical protein RLZZ241_1408 [Bacteroidota bacterium]
MRVLYAIQGTGNGHLSRARDVIPALLRQKVQLDLLVSGIQADIQLPYQVRYRFGGMSFIFGRQGGIDLWNTYLKANSFRLQREIRQLPVQDYDLILSDFEPISAWSCKLRGKICIGLSHQAAVLAPGAPQPEKKDPLGQLILKKYAPVDHQYGFHFESYSNDIYTPVIRQGIRRAKIGNLGHYTVYLPAYSDARIIGVLSSIPNIQWHVFSKHSKHAYAMGNIAVKPIDNTSFLRSITSSTGVLCAAGFETPAEALFMGKKLCVIPMRNQYEQQCNAAALKQMGVTVLEALNQGAIWRLQQWVDTSGSISVDYPDQVDALMTRVLETHAPLVI